jgi:hypothetical protein
MLLHAGANYYVRILSTLNRELLKPSSSVALHRHSNALVDILPPEADSSIAMLGDGEKPDVSYADIGGNDIQKQEIREAVELPLSNPGLYAQVRSLLLSSCRILSVLSQNPRMEHEGWRIGVRHPQSCCGFHNMITRFISGTCVRTCSECLCCHSVHDCLPSVVIDRRVRCPLSTESILLG